MVWDVRLLKGSVAAGEDREIIAEAQTRETLEKICNLQVLVGRLTLTVDC